MKTTTGLCPGCFKYGRAGSACKYCGYETDLERPPFFLPYFTLLESQFLIGRALGQPGGFGVTYLAWDQVLEAPVAIKEYLPREFAGRAGTQSQVRAHTSQDQALFDFGLQKFVEEARTLARLNHTNVVRVRHVFAAAGTSYLVMDYYEGQNLEQYQRGLCEPFPERSAVEILSVVLDGLRHVHETGFLHRDVKPANIYLADLDSGNKRPILLDFGSARVALGERSRSMDVVLTQGFAPFEQYHEKGNQGPWSDVYASAATLYWMVTGDIPPEAASRVREDRLVPPIVKNSALTLVLSDAIIRGLEVMPEDRPQTAVEFQDMLIDAAPGLCDQIVVVSESLGARPSPPPYRSWVRWAVLAAGLLFGLLSFTLEDRNSAPSVENDHWAMRSLGRARLEVLNNDADPEGDLLHIIELSLPLHGSAKVEADGSVTYSPERNFVGRDRFSYVASDGRKAARGEVTLAVEMTRILAWAEAFDGPPEKQPWVRMIKDQAVGRTELVATTEIRADRLGDLLGKSHAFIVAGQAHGRPIPLSEASPASVVREFVEEGGLVVAFCEHSLLSAARMLEARSGTLTQSGGHVELVGNDPIVHGLIQIFDAENLTCAYEVHDPDARILATLNGQAVVVVKEFGRGLVVLIGFTYDSDYQPMNQILLNALFRPHHEAWPRSNPG